MAEAYEITKEEALALMEEPKFGVLPKWLQVKNSINDFDTVCTLLDKNQQSTTLQFKGEIKRGKRAKFTRYVFTLYDLDFRKHRVYQIDSGEELKRMKKTTSQHDCPHEHIGDCREELKGFSNATMSDYMQRALERCNISIKFDDDYESPNPVEFTLKSY